MWNYYHANGKLQAEGYEKGGLKTGLWKFYHDNGGLSSEGTYKNNLEEGAWKYYHANGQVASEGKLEGGKKQGSWNLYYETGKFMAEGVFDKGEGEYKEYYEDGKLKTKGRIVGKNYVGKWIFLYPDGEPEGICEYAENGEGTYTGYFRDGSKRISGKLLNGQKQGVWRLYTTEGSLAGLYKTYFEGQTPVLPADASLPADSIKRVEAVSQRKANLIMPGQEMTFFKPKINELRGFIVAINPVAALFFELPASLEYHYYGRLGYEVGIIAYKNPILQNYENTLKRGDGTVANLGVASYLRQKLYFGVKQTGATYFAQELRHTVMHYHARSKLNELPEQTSYRRDFGLEHTFEFSLLIGKRFFRDYNQNRTITVDVYAGAGVGLRKQFMPSNPEAFSEVSRRKWTLPLRGGVMIGYFF